MERGQESTITIRRGFCVFKTSAKKLRVFPRTIYRYRIRCIIHNTLIAQIILSTSEKALGHNCHDSKDHAVAVDPTRCRPSPSPPHAIIDTAIWIVS